MSRVRKVVAHWIKKCQISYEVNCFLHFYVNLYSLFGLAQGINRSVWPPVKNWKSRNERKNSVAWSETFRPIIKCLIIFLTSTYKSIFYLKESMDRFYYTDESVNIFREIIAVYCEKGRNVLSNWNFTLSPAVKAYRLSRDKALVDGWVINNTSWPIYPREIPGILCTAGSLCLTEFRTPYPSCHI